MPLDHIPGHPPAPSTTSPARRPLSYSFSYSRQPASTLTAAATSFSQKSYSRSRQPSQPRHGWLGRRLLCTFCVVLLSTLSPAPQFSIAGLTEALSCISPTSNTTVQPGQMVDISWQLSDTDKYVFDKISAQLYCMDDSGPEKGLWRSVSTVFSQLPLQAPSGQYLFKLPSCGPLAVNGSFNIIAQGTDFDMQIETEDSCYFSILANSTIPEPLSPSPTPRSSDTPKDHPSSVVVFTKTIGSQTSSAVSPSRTRSSTMSSPDPTNPTDSIIGGSRRTANPSLSASPSSILLTSSSSILLTSSSSILLTSNPTPPTLVPTPPVPDRTAGPNPLTTSPSVPRQQSPHQNVTGGTDGTGGNTGNNGRGSDGAAVTNGITKMGAVVGGAVTGLCVIAMAVAWLVIRNRRQRRRVMMTAASASASGSGSEAAGAARVTQSKMMPGGGVGGVMKETKKHFWLHNAFKEGHFYKMEDKDDNDYDNDITEPHMSEKVSRTDGLGGGSGGKRTKDLAGTTMVETGGHFPSGSTHLASSAQPPLMPPEQVYTGSSLPPHMRRTPSLRGESFSGTSSRRSSFETSSVVRKYWAASMAARAELLVDRDHHSPLHVSGHDLEQGDGGRGGGRESDYYYEEGSNFSEGSRDSDSRMADILSLRTTGSGRSGATMDTTGSSANYRYRRSTLNSMVNSPFKFHRNGTISTTTSGDRATTLSSIPDSLMISEGEFLERLREHELRTQLEQEQYGNGEDGRYYDLDDGMEHTESYLSSRSALSRSNSIPSLTSSNDPFKTFDSNEGLADPDPFSDDYAEEF